MTTLDTTPEAPRRSRTRAVRILAIFGISVVTLVVVLLLFLHSSSGRRFVMAQVTDLLRQQRIEIHADELRYNLLELSVSADNLRVRPQDAADLPPFAEARSVTLDLSLMQLLRGGYVLESGEIAGLNLHYFVAEDGRDNLPRPPSNPDQPSEPLDYLIQSLQVRDARVRYENREADLDVQVPIAAIDVDGNVVTDRHTVRLEAGDGTIVAGERTIAIESLTARFEAGDDDLAFERVEAAIDGARVELSGTLTEFESPRLDLDAKGTVDAARAARLANLTDPVGGTVTFDASIEGRMQTPDVSARVTGTDLRYRDLSGLSLSAEAAYDLGAGRVTVSDLQARAPFGRVSGDGAVAMTGDGTSQATLTVSSFDAAAVMRALDLPYVVATRVDAEVQAQWPGLEYLKASGDATASLTPTAARATRAVIPLGGRLAVTAKAGAIDAAIERLRAPGAEVAGRVRIDNAQDLGGDVRLRVDDLAQVVSAVESLLGRQPGTLTPAPVDGTLRATARLGGTVSAPSANVELNAPTLSLGDASDMALQADVRYQPALVTVNQLAVQWQDASLTANGTLALDDAQRMRFAVEADAIQVAELLRAVGQPDVPASGSLSLQGEVTGTAARPAARVTVDGTGLTAYGELWGSLTARLGLNGRDVVVSDLALDKPQDGGNGQVTGDATFNLDQQTYTLALTSKNLKLERLTLPDGRELRGTLQIDASGQGSVAQPAGDVTLVADALRLGDYELGRLAVDATVANQNATVEATAPGFGMAANAVVGIEAPYPTTATIRVDGLDLAELPIELDTPLEGQVRATVNATADLASPASASGSATIEQFDGTWNGQPFRVDAPARLRYAAERLTIEQLRLIAQDSTVTLSGELPVSAEGAPGTVNVDVRANLATLAGYAPAGTNLTASGEVLLTGTVQGTLRAIDPTLTLTVANGAVATPDITPGVTDLNVRIEVAKGIAAIEQLAASFGSARLTADGRVPFDVLPELPVDVPRPGGPATLTANVDGLELSQVPGAPAGLDGRVSLAAGVSADRADLTALQGRVTFGELDLAFNGLTLAQGQPSVIAIANGEARVEQFALTGSVGTLSAAGTVGLTGNRALNIDVDGALNVAALSVVTDAVRAEGDTTIDIAARGTVASPDLSGTVNLTDATFVIDEPLIAAEGVNARLDLSGRRVTVAELSGAVNGGTLQGKGFVELGDAGIADAALELTLNDVANDFPLDLRSLADVSLNLAKRGDEYVVDGNVTIAEAGLTGDINFDQGVLAALNAGDQLDLTQERNPFLERVRFNVTVETDTPIIVDNNIARAEVTTNLRVLGTPYEPGMSGRLTVLEGGEVILNERRYEVERGVITFIGEREIIPSFDLLLETAARNYDITLAVTGTPGDTETSLTSTPTLPETDIMALLVTGRTLEDMRGEEFEVAREQVLSYLTGRVGSQLGRGLERATGLSSVRIEPNLIANETDPGARLTVGQDLTSDLELIYSVDLTNSSDEIWVAEYDITRRFQTRGVRQSDNSYRFDFSHDVRFGGSPEPSRTPRQRPTVTAVRFDGGDPLSEAELRRLFDVEAGDEFDFIDVRDAADDVREALAERDRLQSRVRLRREGDQKAVALTLEVRPGPRVELAFDGAEPSGKVVDEIRTQWQRGVFDTQRIDDGVEALRAWLMEDDYLQPKVTGVVEEVAADRRRVRFTIEPGTKFERVVLAFNGASGVSPDVLDDIIDEQGLEQQLFTDPIVVTELLERYYREQGYLAAEIETPRYEFEGTQARVVLDVSEGPRFMVRSVSVDGNTALDDATLVGDLPVESGDPFLPFAAANALQRIRDLYWAQGYNAVRADYDIIPDRDAGRLDVRFTVDEGTQSVVAGINVTGNDRTSDRFVREQVELEVGKPLNLKALGRSRSNLYGSGAYSLVDFTRNEQPAGDGVTPVQVNIEVREVQPVQLRYGASFDTESGLGGIADVSSHNALGKARVLGVRTRYDARVREVRGYFSQPSLLYWPVRTNATVYFREEERPETGTTGRFDIDRRGVSIQQERELANEYVWSYGFRYERARSFDPAPGGLLDERVTVSPLNSTFTRETRDDILDATRGSFQSHALEYSPDWLGADDSYVRYFGQYFHYVPLAEPQRERFTNEILRPRFVYAFGARVGLGHSFGLRLPVSERFFAGGSTTLRGLEQNTAGPIGADGLPLGGGALFVLNNELRVPLVSIFDGVAFTDIGNVFPLVSDFSLTDLRKTAGLGLRARTQWFLLRADYGFLLDRRTGEPRGRFFFSIGQAF